MYKHNFYQLCVRLIEVLKNLGIRNKSILQAILDTPRHNFVLEKLQPLAYENTPLPIGYAQTISQPYLVAFMLEAADITDKDTVLDIGTGSGYQAALLSKLCKKIYTVEIIKDLAYQASIKLQELGYDNVDVEIGNGYKMHRSRKKFDAILVSVASTEVPEILIKQLKLNGRLIIPVGDQPTQKLLRVIKTRTGIIEETFFDVSFVPMMTSYIQKDGGYDNKMIK